MSSVPNQSVGHLKVWKYWFFTRAWLGPPGCRMSVRTVSAQGTQPSEAAPQGLTEVLAPLPPTPARAGLSGTAPGCLVSEHSSGSKAPLTLPAARSVLQAAPRNTGCLGGGARLSAPSSVLSPAWDSCQKPCVLPEALKKTDVASRCRRARRPTGNARGHRPLGRPGGTASC